MLLSCVCVFVCTALAKVASIMGDIEKLCTTDALGGETSQEYHKMLTTCAKTAKEKLTTEFNSMEKEEKMLEAEIQGILVKNGVDQVL